MKPARTGEILNAATGRLAGVLDTETCVIGSGCGGATAAWDLAAAGHDVLVLEEGGDFTGGQLTGRDGAMYDQLYMERGGRMTDDLAIAVLQGRVLGGGGVINACDVVPMPAGVRAHWRARYGLTDLTDADFEPFAQRALRDLHASKVPETHVNRANKLLRLGAQRIGAKGDLMDHNRVGCVGFGTCLIGCPANAKRNPRFVAIPGAMTAGARFLTRVRAVRIKGANNERKEVVCRILDTKGNRQEGHLTVRAKTVIVAANAVNSAHLLLRSGIGNEHVGRHLSLQPQLPVMARFAEVVNAFDGIPQAFAITGFEHEGDAERGLSGFRIESIMGTPGIVATMLPYAGAEARQMMMELSYLAAVLVLVPDEATGRVRMGKDELPRISYEHTDAHKAELRAGAKMAARAFLAAGAVEVLVPTVPPVLVRSSADLAAIDALSLAPVTAPLISAHQQGGLRMAPSAKDGATDPNGQVYGTRGIYAFDSSGFPSSASSHTMAPIIAMAHWQAGKL